MLPAKRIKKVKSRNSQEVLHRLEEYLEGGCDKPISILCGFWKDQQDAITYQELRQIVLDGTVSKEALKVWSQDYSILVSKQLSSTWMDAAKAGAAGQPILGRPDFKFNSQTPGIFNWINRHGAEFVTNSTKEQKEAIAALLNKKMIDGHTVDELSRLIRPCIGLTKGQAEANAKFYDNMIAALTKEHPRMSKEAIKNKALDASMKYAERQHRYRAMTIAQTECAFAYNWGADEGVRQAMQIGLIGKCVKVWSTSNDNNVCSICSALEGVTVGMDDDFDFKGKILFEGQHMLPPAHPRCACAVEYVEVEPPKISSPNVNGQETETKTNIGHDKPQYLGSLDDISDGVIKLTLEKYEPEIVKSNVENAIVITKTGLVFQCFGDINGVYPDVDMGDELFGASITHNHPIESDNEYSFSQHDISLFMEYDLKLLRGIDEEYIYELSRDPSEIDSHIILEDLISSEGYMARHEAVIDTAQKLGIGYRRWKR